MLWGLLGSKKRVEEALAESAARRDLSVDLSPDARSPGRAANNNDALAPVAAKSRLWIEDWSEKDEERLRDPETTFGLTWL